MEIIVTRLSNIQVDEEGNFLLDEEGTLLLHDDEDVGILLKTHVVPVSQVIEGVIHTGISQLSEVFWNKQRTPAPSLVAPNELAWLSQARDEEFEEEGDGEEYDDGMSDDEPDEFSGQSFTEQ